MLFLYYEYKLLLYMISLESRGSGMTSDKVRNILFLLSLLGSPAVHAEGDPLIFLDVFGGYSWGGEQDADVKTTVAGQPGTFKWKSLDVHNGPAFGGRMGAWLKTHPSFGVAVDVTRFDTDIDNQTITATNLVSSIPGLVGLTVGSSDIRVANTFVSFDLIWRHRGERFSPYVMAGPGILFANMDNGFLLSDRKQDDTDKTFGYKAGFGISYQISENMHLFTEYRYIHGSPQYDLNQSIDPATGFDGIVNADVDIDVDAHIAVGGVSFRF
ncbi:MAG: opacity protein-like surface antigen [Gammaproteobacteria bacterium]|jgi:opacity protein-like surface antigen